jgi:hypothetical protein
MEKPEEPESPPSAAPSPESIDEHLRYFAYLANNAGLSLPVTINVRGQIISGLVVSHRTYLEKLRDSIADGFARLDEETRDQVKTLTGHLFGMLEEEDPAEKGLLRVEWDNIHFLHLDRIKILGSAGVINVSGAPTIWRTPISRIDGFTYGNLG